jgi:hypothetical protein
MGEEEAAVRLGIKECPVLCIREVIAPTVG